MIGRSAWVVLLGVGCAAGALSCSRARSSSEAPAVRPAASSPIVPAEWNFTAPDAPAPPQILPEGPDRVRGILYRIDGEAHFARLHPSEALDHAKAAARMTSDLGDALRGAPMLQPWAARVTARAGELARAAQRGDPEDVRAAAIEVEMEVRALDDLLPAHQPAR